jgi:hypothetical protein
VAEALDGPLRVKVNRLNKSRPKAVAAVLLSLGAVLAPAALGTELLTPIFRRGDANLDGRIDLSDASFLLDALLMDGPGCLDAADANDDGLLDDKDALYLLDWLYPKGPGEPPPPPPPFEVPGIDLTADGIGCLVSSIEPAGDPAPGVKLELLGPEVIARGQKGLPVLLAATTTGPIDALSIVLLIDREAVRVTGGDLEETIFPQPLRTGFEDTDFFRFRVIPQPDSTRDLLLVGTVFVGPDLERIRFPATTGPVTGAPLLRLLLDVAPDAPLEERTVLENAPAPLLLDAAGPLSGFTAGGKSVLPGTLPSYRVKLVEAGELILSRRADSNNDRSIDITDAVFTLDFLFLGGPPPSCSDSADADDNGAVDISDPVFTLQYLFAGGATPRSPFPYCGYDPTPDSLPVCLESCAN